MRYHIAETEKWESIFDIKLDYNMENKMEHSMHREISQEHTEEQNLSDQPDRYLKTL